MRACVRVSAYVCVCMRPLAYECVEYISVSINVHACTMSAFRGSGTRALMLSSASVAVCETLDLFPYRRPFQGVHKARHTSKVSKEVTNSLHTHSQLRYFQKINIDLVC